MTRVPEFLMYNKSQDSVSKVRDKMMKSQEQGVTGKRVNRASDDPVAAMRGVGLKSQLARDEQISQNLELATSVVNLTDSSLAELSDIMSRTKELALQMSSSSNNTEDSRLAVSKEIDQLRLRAVQIGNTRMGDRFLFGGYTSDRPPFDEHGNYYGDDGVAQLEIDKGQKLSINMPGLMPFFGLPRLPDRAPLFENPGEDTSTPNVSGDLRSPASLLASREGLDPSLQQDQYSDIQKQTGVNIFSVMQNFADALKTGDIHAVHDSIDGLDAGFKQIIQSRAMIGARQNALKISQESVETSKESGQTLISKTEDADVLKVYSDLSKNENSLKAALEINRKILTPSLIEFLK